MPEKKHDIFFTLSNDICNVKFITAVQRQLEYKMNQDTLKLNLVTSFLNHWKNIQSHLTLPSVNAEAEVRQGNAGSPPATQPSGRAERGVSFHNENERSITRQHLLQGQQIQAAGRRGEDSVYGRCFVVHVTLFLSNHYRTGLQARLRIIFIC